MPIFDNILATIGRTPVVKINRLAPAGVHMYVKAEFFNPMSSVKDRLAYAVIDDATKSGALKPGQTVVEATSGNTGIALAMVCAARGHPFVATMVETFSIERRKLMRFLGAKVVLTPKEERGSGMVKKAAELSKEKGWFLPSQFTNPANPSFHAATTGPEILSDFAGRPLDYWVTGWGTGGTLVGAGRVMRAARPDTKIVVTEPMGAQLLKGEPWNAHKIQGWTPDFVPEIIQGEIKAKGQDKVYDEMEPVTDEESIEASQMLATKEGIFTGISGGGSFAAALKVAKRAPSGSHILCMLPDTGERYLSTALYEGINEGTDDVE
uniref:Tryptophan synthase beta chain-like PALP domain-containing protein n=1 Tax=Chromera velia CCMP2878 TaxID=1169474 RepID=A0A0G4GU03_9ALVE|mmetsp:Transcript_14744/g.29767  ORF Transcript_14744/g.29767 Transcript_14744/m.29767 type:complete len:323 (+) Transcript_14744:140-1108(+)|eukprot:Cvel_745.t1-p1 / transcript=Cvel_745.t1 / gene=Cvel_745 / organism=Chromera_velia_CCMP2878 / gene_product=Cysteine synthase, putative / transcript_product=Cysteine synthase, putative / location=Cvel_scaffold23:45937-50072(+) / protein_length=322 / sequence_SO=supercontig / SO=protein_coding / is_pseudo=false